jgi:lipopolysaccharide export system permease protein
VRSGRGSGFAIGLLIFLAYYVLLSVAGTLVVEGNMPGLLLWAPNLIFLMAGVVLLKAAAKEKPLPLTDTFRTGMVKLLRLVRKQ